jgi:hypothetical protein
VKKLLGIILRDLTVERHPHDLHLFSIKVFIFYVDTPRPTFNSGLGMSDQNCFLKVEIV